MKNDYRTYSYDVAGFVVNDSKRSYCWTSFGQLKSVCYDAAPKLIHLDGTDKFSAGKVFSSFDFDAAGNVTAPHSPR